MRSSFAFPAAFPINFRIDEQSYFSLSNWYCAYHRCPSFIPRVKKKRQRKLKKKALICRSVKKTYQPKVSNQCVPKVGQWVSVDNNIDLSPTPP